MDILNFISWIRGGRLVDAVDPKQSLLAVGVRDAKRDDGYLTNAITVENFGKQVRGYLAYTASIAQSSDNDPSVVIEFENTLEVNVTYTREDVGIYTVSFDKPIFSSPNDYCVLLNNTTINPSGPISYVAEIKPVFFNIAVINTFVDGVPSDDVLGNGSQFLPNTILDVRVYPNAVPIF